MSRTDVTIDTPDGACPAYSFTPDGQGPWPAVVMLMDAPAIRPILFEMAERLAGHGYYVLLPDLFYRDGPYAPLDVSKMFADEEARKAIFAKIGKCMNPDAAKGDMGAFLAFLDSQPQVKGPKVGVTGYCMGGRLSLTAAANFPGRVAAAGSFHPGNIGNDQDPNSPHHRAGEMKARIYVGGADADNSFPPEQKDRLEQALAAAGVPHRVEIYTGARHGYTMKDLQVYDEPAAERHWSETLGLFDGTLKAA
jgi:carboxymethylenebutenolidase